MLPMFSRPTGHSESGYSEDAIPLFRKSCKSFDFLDFAIAVRALLKSFVCDGASDTWKLNALRMVSSSIVRSLISRRLYA